MGYDTVPPSDSGSNPTVIFPKIYHTIIPATQQGAWWSLFQNPDL
jgi:hypothetical protein